MAHALNDEFGTLLDRSQYVSTSGSSGRRTAQHLVYGPMLGRSTTFNHHDPALNDNDFTYLVRTCRRLNYWLCNTTTARESPRAGAPRDEKEPPSIVNRIFVMTSLFRSAKEPEFSDTDLNRVLELLVDRGGPPFESTAQQSHRGVYHPFEFVAVSIDAASSVRGVPGFSAGFFVILINFI